MKTSGARGVTLIELMVALTIMLLVAGAISQSLVHSWLSEQTVTEQNQAQKTAQQAVDVIADRLRAGRLITSGAAEQITISFGDDSPVVSLSYWRTGDALHRSSLLRSGGTVSEVVIPNSLTGLTLRYGRYNGAGWEPYDGTPTGADCVKVSVTATSGRSSAIETSIVQLRNNG